MCSIFNEQNKINIPIEKNKDREEHEKLTKDIEKMSMEEVWGKKEEVDLTASILKIFPNSKVISEKEVEKPYKPLRELLTPQNLQTPIIDSESLPVKENHIKKSMLEEALSFVRDGFSIIPVGINKRPLLAWQEYQKRLPTEEEITKWFTQWPKAQIAMVTGSISDVCVVDVEKEFGDYKTLNLPETIISQTGSGGWHLFYKNVIGVRNRAKIEGKEVDIRGEGGYCLLPPSFNEAGEYEWIGQKLERKNLLLSFPTHIFSEDVVVKRKDFDKGDHNFVDLDFKGVAEGGRNDKMTRYIGAILTQVHPNSWEQLAWPVILMANNKNEPPLSEDELKRTFDSVCRIEKETEQKRWWEHQNKLKEIEKEEEIKVIQESGEDKIMHISEAAEERRKLSKGKRYSSGFTNFDNAMKGGFKEGDFVVVTGQSGQGKTSCGQSFTHNLCSIGVSCCWFSWETTIDVLDDKFINMGLSAKNFYNVYVPRKNSSGDIAWLRAKIIEAVGGFGVKAFFVDMIDYIVPNGIKRSDNETIILKRAATELKALAVDLKVIIFTMAHIRKLPKNQEEPELQDIAQSAGIYNFSDYVFGVSRKSEMRRGIDGKNEKIWLNEGVIRMLKSRETGEMAKEICSHENDLFFSAIPIVKDNRE